MQREEKVVLTVWGVDILILDVKQLIPQTNQFVKESVFLTEGSLNDDDTNMLCE